MAENLETDSGLVYQDLITDKVSRVLSCKEHSMKGFPLYHMFPFHNMHRGALFIYPDSNPYFTLQASVFYWFIFIGEQQNLFTQCKP